MSQDSIQPKIQAATNAFKKKLALHFDVRQTFLFGSMARHTEHAESDTDVAVVLNGETGKFIDTKFAMDDLAYEVLFITDPPWHQKLSPQRPCAGSLLTTT